MNNMAVNRRLLVIDDEPAFCSFVRATGKLLDYDVRTAGSGREVMETSGPLSWDAIVLDIVMPDVDGIEIVRWLTKRGYAGRLVVVSGYTPDYARMACELAKANGIMQVEYHIKPISVEDLLAALS